MARTGLEGLDRALAQLFGSDRGDPGFERALFGVQSGVLPEALEVEIGRPVEFKGTQDVKLTIDRALQQTAVDLLKGKVCKLRDLSPLWELYKAGIDLSTIQWAAH